MLLIKNTALKQLSIVLFFAANLALSVSSVAQNATLVASLTGTSTDNYGFNIAASNALLAVGAWGHDDQRGAVILSAFDGSSYRLVDTLKSPVYKTSGFRDRFGCSVAFFGDDYLAVGARGWNVAGLGYNTGAVLVYHYDGTEWALTHTILGTIATGGFGATVDMPDANHVVATSLATGVAKVYSLASNGTATQVGGNITIAPNASLSMPTNTTVAFGDPTYSSGTANGKVDIYDWNGSAWVARTSIEGPLGSTTFGQSIAMPNDATIGISNPKSNQVSVYTWSDPTWTQKGSSISGAGTFGYDIDMYDENRVLSGAPYSTTNNGGAEEYTWNGSNWVLTSNFDGPLALGNSGQSVAYADANSYAVSNLDNVQVDVAKISSTDVLSAALYEGTIEVSAGASLEVNNLFVASGAQVNLRSNSNDGYAQLKVNGTMTMSGNVLMEQTVSVASGASGLSSPMTNGWTSVAGANSQRLYIYDANAGSYVFDTLSWTQPGVGFFAPITADNGFMSGAGTFTLTGTPNTTHTHSLGFVANTQSGGSGSGWNLIGNPYTCALDWSTVTKTNVNNAIYIWDQTLHKYNYFVSGITAPENPGSAIDPQVAPMQSFWVQSTQAGASISTTMAENGSVEVAPTLYKSMPDNLVVGLKSTSDSSIFDYTWFKLMSGMSDGFDGEEDAWKWANGGNNINVYSVANDEIFAVNAIDVIGGKSVELGFDANLGESYTISLSAVTNGTEYSVTLEDRLSGGWWDLGMGDYTFSNTAWTGKGTRFVLHIDQSVVGIDEEAVTLASVVAKDGALELSNELSETLNYDIHGINGQLIANGTLNANAAAKVEVPTSGIYVISFESAQLNDARKVLVTK